MTREIISLDSKRSLQPIICSLITLISTAVSQSSVLTLVLISIDRYALFRNNKLISKRSFRILFYTFQLISFSLGITNAISNVKFKTVMHVRCTNEPLTHRMLNEIIYRLERYGYLLIIHKSIFFLICVASLAAIIFCYVSICKIIKRNKFGKSNNSAIQKVGTNHSLSNKVYYPVTYDHQLSLTKNSEVEDFSIAKFEIGDPSNSVSENLNNDFKKKIMFDEILPFLNNCERRWSTDLNESQENYNGVSSSGILKKSSLKKPINRKNSTVSNTIPLNISQTESINEEIYETFDANSYKTGDQIFYKRQSSLKFNEPLKMKSSVSINESTTIFPFRKKLSSIHSQVSSKLGSGNSISHNYNTNTSSDITNISTNYSNSVKANKNHSALKKTSFIILVFFIFWIPYLIVQWIILIYGNRAHLVHLNLLSIAAGFCHSSIAPLVYCCTNNEIFKAIKAQFSIPMLNSNKNNNFVSKLKCSKVEVK